ncbi:MAG: enoyl-CoA hydratase/isomerase family protein [Bdellovibrionales bacterium]|nr:enoyl-CoA hydratase/isomerase family protein [Bdellovibrionales bacterium]
MEKTPAVSLAVEDGVAHVRINREESLNALSVEVLEGLLDAASQLAQSCRGADAYQLCRAVVLRGAGSKAFAAGADIKLMEQADGRALREFVELGQDVMHAYETLPLPVIAVVQGYALGGGMELALACDVILAGKQAKFGQPEVALGLIPGFGGTQRLTARSGAGTAKRLILTGETVDAEEALRLGLVEWVVPNEELEEKVRELCETLRQRAPLALAAAKRAVQGSFRGRQEGFRLEVEEFTQVFASADAKRGLTAFVKKEKPHFEGS